MCVKSHYIKYPCVILFIYSFFVNNPTQLCCKLFHNNGAHLGGNQSLNKKKKIKEKKKTDRNTKSAGQIHSILIKSIHNTDQDEIIFSALRIECYNVVMLKTKNGQ